MEKTFLAPSYAGCDPQSKKRRSGAVYTPETIVEGMLEWARGELPAPERVVDPGCGSGRFLISAARRFPNAELVGIDIDPVAALMLRANANLYGFGDRLRVLVQDYRRVVLPKISGKTLFIGNPPYVRHHGLDEAGKVWFSTCANRFGVKVSKLAGLHVHFFFKTRELAKPGDCGAFITAAVWLDVNYGAGLRKLLADGLGGTAVHVIRPDARPFQDALTTGAITCFRVGNRAKTINLRSVPSVDDLMPLRTGDEIDFSKAAAARKWSIFFREKRELPADFIELGELFRVHRGQVTGNNTVWIENAQSIKLPDKYKYFSIVRARELIAAGLSLDSTEGLRRVVDLPVDLERCEDRHQEKIQRFLAWAREQGADKSYIASHRRAWWSVGLRAPAPVLCTYMGRRPPVFVRNRAAARHINIAHGLYPRVSLSENVLTAIVTWLSRNVSTSDGRAYAGGLVKFEPREIERIFLPQPGEIDAYLLESRKSSKAVVAQRTSGGRGGGEEGVSPRTDFGAA